MKSAMLEAGYTESDKVYINAHGTSTKYNDLYETNAIKDVFKDHAKKLRINSTKSMIGHLMGGAGAVEGVVSVLSIKDGFVHRTINHRVFDEELDLNYMFEKGEYCPVNYALSNSFGFGGHNSTIIFKRYDN